MIYQSENICPSDMQEEVKLVANPNNFLSKKVFIWNSLNITLQNTSCRNEEAYCSVLKKNSKLMCLNSKLMTLQGTGLRDRWTVLLLAKLEVVSKQYKE